ncbi:MAG: hypothetical protein HY854_05670 [Burkholderiales bacterium]|nr:hypothetical protein [Burkholderiales bacterium]
MSTGHPMRCACGKVRGVVEHPRRATRAVCYCRDCQAFAHFLGPPPGMLDAAGGTEVIAVRPHLFRFTAGTEHVACMSLTPKGLLRWYASCCNSPIGNTPRDPRIPHLGLVHSCLGKDTEAVFGPVTMRANRKRAKQPVPGNSPVKFGAALLRFLASMGRARITGQYKHNPFFQAGLVAPLAKPRVLTESEHAELMRKVTA